MIRSDTITGGAADKRIGPLYSLHVVKLSGTMDEVYATVYDRQRARIAAFLPAAGYVYRFAEPVFMDVRNPAAGNNFRITWTMEPPATARVTIEPA
jgi:hypothetical protein